MSEKEKYIKQLLMNAKVPGSNPKLNIAITDIMHEIGIPAHLLGYKYIRRAIYITILFPEVIDHATRVLYPSVATFFKTTTPRTERVIRNAIDVGWKNTPPEVVNKYFGNSIDKKRGKPTSTEFIATIADVLTNRKNIENT